MTHCIIVLKEQMGGMSYYQAPIELMTSEVCTTIQAECRDILRLPVLDILTNTENKKYRNCEGTKLCSYFPECLKPLWNKVEFCDILSCFPEPGIGSWGKFLYVDSI